MIPKIIHYCWFGKNPKNEIIEKCINSWKKYCGDWQIIEWNEDNYDISKIPYVEEAYESKKWAFVADVVRLEVVNKYGGIYLDTDVELLENIDFLLKNEAFYFFESDRNIATGLGFGACPHHKSISCLLSFYNDRHFIVNGKLDLTPCPNNNSEMLKRCYPSFHRNGKSQYLDNCCIYSNSEYHQIMKHYGTATWIDGKKKERIFKDTKVKRFLRKSEIFDYIEKKAGRGSKILKIYTFVVYDLFENGLGYYIKRKIHKIIRS